MVYDNAKLRAFSLVKHGNSAGIPLFFAVYRTRPLIFTVYCTGPPPIFTIYRTRPPFFTVYRTGGPPFTPPIIIIIIIINNYINSFVYQYYTIHLCVYFLVVCLHSSIPCVLVCYEHGSLQLGGIVFFKS